MEAKFKLVEELDIKYQKILDSDLTCLIMIIHPIILLILGYIFSTKYLAFLVLLSFIIIYISSYKYGKKYNNNINYKETGTLILNEDYIIIESSEGQVKYKLNESITTLYFKYIRGFSIAKYHDSSDGINEVIINEISYKFLLEDFKDLDILKALFHYYYENKYNFSEFTRSEEPTRLIELEFRFEWDRLQEIKSFSTVQHLPRNTPTSLKP